MVAETHLEATLDYLRELADKLYKRNPKEWHKSKHQSRSAAVNNLFRNKTPEPAGKKGIDAIQLAFEEDYPGDRVQAFIAGLTMMTLASYNNQREFFILDELNAQKLYNCARNFEVAAWLLRSRLTHNNAPYFLSNEMGATHNLSFERLFGKIIAEQDSIAEIIANKTNRRLKNVIQTMVFLPI